MEQLIVFGNPGNRRTEGLQRARAAFGLAPAIVVPYVSLLRDGLSLDGVVRAHGLQHVPVGLRLDAPGESFEVEKELIALGAPDRKLAEDDDRLLPFAERPDPEPWSSRNALAMPEQTGRLYHPSQWFRGFGRLLARLEREAAELCSGTAWWNAPGEVMAMFDKRRTHQVLRAAGVSVPVRLAAPDELPAADALRETMLRTGMHRVFVKLAPGSGACGVLAYQINPVTGAERAITTVGFERLAARPPVLFSTKKVRSYTDGRDIALILNWLLRHGAHVERWIAKAEHGGGTYDIRQLVVAGVACHSVARVSRTPITNLHLRSERMDVNLLGLSLDTMEAVRGCAEQAAAAFPACAVAGIDVLVSRHTHRVYAIDVNPFGDLLYNITYRGYDAYSWEVRRLCGNHADETSAETASATAPESHLQMERGGKADLFAKHEKGALE